MYLCRPEKDGVTCWGGTRMKDEKGEGKMTFSLFPRALSHDPKVSTGAKAMYPLFAEMAYKSDGGAGSIDAAKIIYSDPIKDIMAAMDISRSTYNRLARELKQAGYLYMCSTDHPLEKRKRVTCYFVGTKRDSAEGMYKASKLFHGKVFG